jgi:DNA polymerase-3 subunit gamma/tau
MAYVVLARKWRPSTFDQVVGQEHVCRTLKRALELGRWSHAYLFSGPRGVGKTTVARILAKALNCDQGPGPQPCNKCSSCEDIAGSRGFDVLEIDGASHRGIDEIRTLRENVRYAASQGKHKVYIIDEVHMLTTEAFNALLKTLEEPPPNVVFVFATTESHKVPATIASRCQRFEFRKIASSQIRHRLEAIAAAEAFTITEEALGLIARRADGSMRDAEGLLDQAIAFADGPVEPHHLEELLGETGEQSVAALLGHILAHDAQGILALLDNLLQAGTDPGQLTQGFGDYLRDLLLVKVGAQTDSLGTISKEQLKRLADAASNVAEEDLVAMLTLWAPLQRELRTSPQPRLSLELAALRLAKRERAATVHEVLERLRQAEQLMLEGVATERALAPHTPRAEPQAARVAEPETGPDGPQPLAAEPEAARTKPAEEQGESEPTQTAPDAAEPEAESEAARTGPAEAQGESETMQAEPAASRPLPAESEAARTEPAETQREAEAAEAESAGAEAEVGAELEVPGGTSATPSADGPAAPSEWTVDQWPRLVQELRADSRGLAALLFGTQVEEEEPGHYVILFPERHNWHLEQVEAPEHLSVIVQTLTHHTGRRVAVVCRLKSGLLVDEPAEEPAEPQEEAADPAVKRVIEVFRGDLLGYERAEGEGSDES